MPATSDRQKRFMCAEYGKRKRGRRTKTKMNRRQLRDFCKSR